MTHLPSYLFVLLILCISCDNNISTTEEISNQETPTTKNKTKEKAPRPNYFAEEEQVILRKRISQELINQLSNSIYAIEDAATDQEMEKAIQQSTQILKKTEEVVLQSEAFGNDIAEEWRFVDEASKVYITSCVAECTEFRFEYNIKHLATLAKKTRGEFDDSYFSLLQLADGTTGGREGGWYGFFERTWDYGGGSLLGKGICYDFLNQSWQHLQASDLFAASIKKIRQACLSDMSHPIYMANQKAVLDELAKIQNSGILTTEEAEKVAQIKTHVVAKSTPNATIQFDCNDPAKNCDWGG